MKEHILVTLAKRQFLTTEREAVQLVDEPEINAFLNDFEQHPHAYVLGCLMDCQMKSEKAFAIPWLVKESVGSFSIDCLAEYSEEFYQNLFISNNLHRFSNEKAKVFHAAIQQIENVYDGDASRIWADNPSSAAVVYRFLQFKGCGIKIATMATNILARQFKIPLSDYYSIDISPDVHVDRVLKRAGLVNMDASREEIIYKAREMNPEFPGIIDFSCWEIGRQFCRPKNPLCNQCPIKSECQYTSDNYNNMKQYMDSYSEDTLIKMCNAVGDIQFFYREAFVKSNNVTSDNEPEYYSEVVAKWVLENIDSFKNIVLIRRSNSYYTKDHQAQSNRPNVFSEEQIALKMFLQGTISGVGKILDYQTPLTNPDGNKDKTYLGKIDLLAYDKDKHVLRILELKHPNSKETMLRCILEAYTYLKQVDHKKLIEDFNRDGKANIPENTPIVACPFIFRYNTDGAYSQQYQEYQEMLEDRRPNLKTLMELLDINPLIIEGSEGQYTAREL